MGNVGPFGEWSLEVGAFNLLRERVPSGSTVLEFGSGEVSGILSAYYNLYSVESDQNFLWKYRTNYIYCPIKDGWYDKDVIYPVIKTLKFSCLIIDGPCSSVRNGILNHSDHIPGACKDIFIFADDMQESWLKDPMEVLMKTWGRNYEIRGTGAKEVLYTL